MKNYLDLCRKTLETGIYRGDRTGKGTYSILAPQLRFDLREGFPLVTSKKMHLRSIIHELLWFLRGSTNNEELKAVGVSIWNEWAVTEDVCGLRPLTREERVNDYHELTGIPVEQIHQILAVHDAAYARQETGARSADRHMTEIGLPEFIDDIIVPRGELGPVYGRQWRQWEAPNGEHIDQLQNILEEMTVRPFSRRLIVSAWNPAVLPTETVSPQQNAIEGRQALAACHTMFQFINYPLSDAQRQAIYDKRRAAEGLPVATKDASPETLDAAQVPRIMANLHLYQRSADSALGVPFNVASYALLLMMASQQCGYEAGELVISFGDYHLYSDHVETMKVQLERPTHPLPTMRLNPDVTSVFDFKYEDFTLEHYTSEAKLSYPISV